MRLFITLSIYFSSHFLHLCNIVFFFSLKYSSLVLCVCIMVLMSTRKYVVHPMLSNGRCSKTSYRHA